MSDLLTESSSGYLPDAYCSISR